MDVVNFTSLTNGQLSLYALTATATALLIYGTQKYLLDRLLYRIPPGPAPIPFIGSLWYLAWKGPKLGFVKTLKELVQNYGPVFTLYMGPHRIVFLDDAKIIHETLEHDQGKFFLGRYEHQRMPGMEKLGQGVVFSSGETWRKHRRFGLKAMRDFGMGKEVMVGKIHDEVLPLLAVLAATDGQPFNPKRILMNSVSNVICSLAFGKRFESSTDPEFVRLMDIMAPGFEGNAVQMGLQVIFPFLGRIFKPALGKSFDLTFAATKPMMMAAIADHRTNFDPENIRDFPDLFIQAERQGEPLDIASFVTLVNDLFGAGTETTSTALTWTLLYLTKYPKIQRKCQETIDQVIESDRLPMLEDRSRLVYIDAVMQEALRHSSVAHLGLSHCNENVPAKIAGYDIPPWTMVMYNVKSVHFDPRYWLNPEEFNPDRWLGSDGRLLSHPSHFIPFGLGPRVCLGEGLARVEYFIFLVAMLHRFEFKLATSSVSLEDGKFGMVHIPPAYEITAVTRQ